MLSESPIVRRLVSALATAHGRAPAEQAIAGVREETGASVFAMRHALDHVRRDPDASRAFVWPTVETVREAVESLDAAIDRALIASVATAPIAALARDLESSGHDHARAARSLDIVWKHLAPPAARASATLIDLLRAYPLGAARVTAYRYLVSRNADIRSPLADDTALSAEDRMTALCELAARNKDLKGTRALDWSLDPTATLARALADWTRFATHPRQLFFWYRTRARVGDDIYRHRLGDVRTWPLSPEVRAQLERELSREPKPIPARPAGAGRYECGLCGSIRVTAIGRDFVDARDPVLGVQTEYACLECQTVYFTAWECAKVDASALLVPQARLPFASG